MGHRHGRRNAGGIPRVPEDVQPDQAITARALPSTDQRVSTLILGQ